MSIQALGQSGQMTKSVGLYPSKCVEVRDNRNTKNNF